MMKLANLYIQDYKICADAIDPEGNIVKRSLTMPIGFNADAELYTLSLTYEALHDIVNLINKSLME